MLRAVWALARADFLERVRRHAFLVTLGITVYAAYVFLPPQDSAYATLRLGSHRGLYNSAWVGSAVAMLASSFLSFIGFYLVKNSVERDVRSGVGQILASTPLSKPAYTLGKGLSNFAVLASIVAVVAVAAGVMQIVIGEDRRLDLAALLLPFVFIALPAMAVIAGLAVLFECIPVLRGGGGNILYFFLWGSAISAPVMFASAGVTLTDPLGLALVVPNMLRACQAAYPGFDAAAGYYTMGFNFRESGVWHLDTFHWAGVEWGLAQALSRLVWLGVGTAIALAAAVPFDRFDTARLRLARRPSRSPIARVSAAGTRLLARLGTLGRGGPAERRDSASARETHPIAAGTTVDPSRESAAARETHSALRTAVVRSFSFPTLVLAELGLLLKGLGPWWYAVALGLWIACLFAPLEVSRGKLLAFAWVWPMLRWSSMGARERRHATEELVLSAPRPLWRQLPAAWLAGVAVAMLTGGGAALRLGLAGEWPALAGWAVGALFIPSLAVALGVWSGSGKLFEVIYLLLWYMGPINGVPFLDFTGTPAAIDAGAPRTFLAASVILSALAVVGRWLQSRGR